MNQTVTKVTVVNGTLLDVCIAKMAGMARCCALLFLLAGFCGHAWAQTNKRSKKYIEQAEQQRHKADSLSAKRAEEDNEVEDNPFLQAKNQTRTSVDSARIKGQTNYLDYVMDSRYLPKGEDEKHHYYDRLYLQVGGGLQQMAPPKDNYRFDPLTTASLGMGMELSYTHSLRLLAEGGLGYQHQFDRRFKRLGGRLDHLFNLSSYFNGYHTTRLLSVSTLLGVGAHYSRMDDVGESQMAAEGHVGLQLGFNTGPHGTFTIEPYAGLGSDGLDLSAQRNWRGVDFFYGVNMNYVYYFSNQLSRAARMRQMSRRSGKNYLSRDSLLQSWRHPWFVEVAAGPAVIDDDDLKLLETMGHSISLSVGKWLSPVLGLRLSGAEREVRISKTPTHHGDAVYDLYRHSYYVSLRGEALFNPLGLISSFHWDSASGFYLSAGAEMGWFNRLASANRSLHCYSEAYTAAATFWARLSDGVKFFVEPRLVHTVYHIPYSNVDWGRNYSDNCYQLNVGVSILGQGRRYGSKETEERGKYHWPLPRWTAGVAAGVNLIQVRTLVHDYEYFPAAFSAFGQYHFSNVSSLRLGIDYLWHSGSDVTSFFDYNTSEERSRVRRKGLWNHHYYLAFMAADYSMNLANAMRSERSGRHRFDFEIFGGPAVAWFIGQTGSLSKQEYLLEGHHVHSLYGVKRGLYPGVHGGAKLSLGLSGRVGLFLMPQLYAIPGIDMQAVDITRVGLIETLGLGMEIYL